MADNTISTYEIAQLKKEVRERFSTAVHFHDSCGGQSFSLDKNNDEISAFISDFFGQRNIKVRFSADGSHFYTL
jgi:type IV secretory pathway TraG/TraD family ATPase VirD4